MVLQLLELLAKGFLTGQQIFGIRRVRSGALRGGLLEITLLLHHPFRLPDEGIKLLLNLNPLQETDRALQAPAHILIAQRACSSRPGIQGSSSAP